MPALLTVPERSKNTTSTGTGLAPTILSAMLTASSGFAFTIGYAFLPMVSNWLAIISLNASLALTMLLSLSRMAKILCWG
jgi:hypothetical protein